LKKGAGPLFRYIEAKKVDKLCFPSSSLPENFYNVADIAPAALKVLSPKRSASIPKVRLSLALLL